MNLRAIEHNHIYKSEPIPESLNKAMPRRSGKTTMIKEMIRKHHETFPNENIYVFVPTHSHAEEYKAFFNAGICWPIVATIQNIHKQQGIHSVVFTDDIKNEHNIISNISNITYMGGLHTP